MLTYAEEQEEYRSEQIERAQKEVSKLQRKLDHIKSQDPSDIFSGKFHFWCRRYSRAQGQHIQAEKKLEYLQQVEELLSR